MANNTACRIRFAVWVCETNNLKWIFDNILTNYKSLRYENAPPFASLHSALGLGGLLLADLLFFAVVARLDFVLE